MTIIACPVHYGEHFFFFFSFPCSCLYKFLQLICCSWDLFSLFSQAIPKLFPSYKNYIFFSILWVLFSRSLGSFLLPFSGLLPAVHNGFKVCCVTLRRAFQPKPLSRLEGLLRLPHTSRKTQFLLSYNLNCFGSHPFFFHFTDAKPRCREIMWITPFHTGNSEILELSVHMLNLGEILYSVSHIWDFIQWFFPLLFSSFTGLSNLSTTATFSMSWLPLLSALKFSEGFVSLTGYKNFTQDGLKHLLTFSTFVYFSAILNTES